MSVRMYYERFYWLDKSSYLLNSFIFEICLDYQKDGGSRIQLSTQNVNSISVNYVFSYL